MFFHDISNVVFSIGRVKNKIYYPLGTCTLVNNPGTFITAAHVINGSDEDLFIKINDYEFSDYQDYQQTNFRLLPAKLKQVDSVRDT